EIFAGTRKLMREQNIPIEEETETIMETLEHDGKTAMLIAISGELVGVIAVADTVKETSKEAVARMHKLGLEVIMLTGDNERTADAIAKQVDIDVVIAEVLPDQKSDKIEQLQSQGKKVAMVGDGIIDAPAVAMAEVGMAEGSGTDIAIDPADTTLMRGDINSVADAVTMRPETIRNIKENLFCAVIYNTIG